MRALLVACLTFACLIVACLTVACLCSAPSSAQSPRPVEQTLGCERVSHPIVDFQRASLVLRADGSFELHHTHTSPERGWSTWIRGTFVRTPTELVLRPVAAIRRVWEGDMHRQEHGEDVGARQWQEPVSTAAWHVRPTSTGQRECFSLTELGTEVCSDVVTPALCTAGPPPVRPRP